MDVTESAVTSVEFKWKPPKDSGGCTVSAYIIERRQVGRNKWSNVGEIPGSNPSFKDSDVDPGRRYCYRIRAKNAEGISDYLQTEDISAGVLRKALLELNIVFTIIGYGEVTHLKKRTSSLDLLVPREKYNVTYLSPHRLSWPTISS